MLLETLQKSDRLKNPVYLETHHSKRCLKIVKERLLCLSINSISSIEKWKSSSPFLFLFDFKNLLNLIQAGIFFIVPSPSLP
jgi:hypothetical protein